MVLGDINDQMLRVGRDRCIDNGELKGLSWCQCDAEMLPYPSESFNRVTIGFGLRNVTEQRNCTKEMYRVLKPGGKALMLGVLKGNFSALITDLRRV